MHTSRIRPGLKVMHMMTAMRTLGVGKTHGQVVTGQCIGVGARKRLRCRSAIGRCSHVHGYMKVRDEQEE